MLILCTNDDGYFATGLKVLAEAAERHGTVEIVAPDREQSACSHSLTMHAPLRAHRFDPRTRYVDGTPTDCVALAVGALLERRPDVVLSGVNHGANMGEDVLYSGTVAGAMEATILGIPAVAISYCGRDPDAIHAFGPLVSDLLAKLIERSDFPPETLLNVNLPPIAPDAVRGIRVTHLGRRTYTDSLTRDVDPQGREYYWIGGGGVEWSGAEGSDFWAVDQGFISITPLHLDLTNHPQLGAVRNWSLDL